MQEKENYHNTNKDELELIQKSLADLHYILFIRNAVDIDEIKKEIIRKSYETYKHSNRQSNIIY